MINLIIKTTISMLACVMMAGCHGDIREIWVEGSGRVPTSASAPEGFKISPHEAQVVAEKQFGMRKTVQHIYADSRLYYIVDGFFGSNRSKAAKAGVRVDGKSGKCERFEGP